MLLAPAQPRVVGRAVGHDLGDDRAGLDLELEPLGELRVERLGGDPRVGVGDLAVVAQVLDRALREVDRDGESDPLVAPRGGVDLLIDPDHLPLGVEQRAAGVARVDRGIGLDRTLDPEVGQRLDRAVRRRDDADRERLLLPERAPDRRHPVADLDVGLRAERERAQVEPLGIDLQQCDVGERVEADDLGLDLVQVRKLDVDLPRRVERPDLGPGRARVGDHVGVGDDLAVVGDHEARALALAASAAEHPRARVADDRAHRDHPRRRTLIDRV